MKKLFDKDKPCTHPNGFEFSGKTPGTGYEVCRMCGERKPSSKKQIPRLGMFEESNEPLQLTSTGREDDWSRPIYTDQNGKVYVDVNLGNGTPSIHSISDDGEPEFPVKNFTIKQSAKQDRFKDALCPRCKNSKPELMKKTPEGKMSCALCHWEESPGQPYNPPIKEGDEADAAQDMYADHEAEHYFKNYIKSKKPSIKKPSTSSKAGKIKVKGKKIDPSALVKECILEVLAENLSMRSMKISEVLTPKSIQVIQKWQETLKDNRIVAEKIIDSVLSKKIGLTSSDLPDNMTFSGGLDMIEDALESGNYESAFDIAKDTANEMIEEAGGPGMDEGFDPQSMAGPNGPDQTGGNPYEKWNSDMRKLEEEGDGFNSVKGSNPAATWTAQMFPYKDQNDKMRQMEELNTDTLKEQIYSKLEAMGFRRVGEQQNQCVEYYVSGFATIQCCVRDDLNEVHIEKYYDNEMLSDRNFLKKIKIPEQSEEMFIDKIVNVCSLLKKSIIGDESLFGGMDDIHEKKISHADIDAKVETLEQEWDRLDSQGNGGTRQAEIRKEIEHLQHIKEPRKKLDPDNVHVKKLWSQLKRSVSENGKTFQEIKNELDPDGTKHDLTLRCTKCGKTETCRCSKPKRKVEGICDNCSK